MTSWKGCGRKQLWPNFKVLSQNLPGGTEESQKHLLCVMGGIVSPNTHSAVTMLFCFKNVHIKKKSKIPVLYNPLEITLTPILGEQGI
jgi:hypothetical protein